MRYLPLLACLWLAAPVLSAQTELATPGTQPDRYRFGLEVSGAFLSEQRAYYYPRLQLQNQHFGFSLAPIIRNNKRTDFPVANDVTFDLVGANFSFTFRPNGPGKVVDFYFVADSYYSSEKTGTASLSGYTVNALAVAAGAGFDIKVFGGLYLTGRFTYGPVRVQIRWDDSSINPIEDSRLLEWVMFFQQGIGYRF